MRFRENLRSSFRALGHKRMRSFLTMLGVIVGVFSVVMLTSIGEGVKRQVTAQVESLGANLLYVMPGKMAAGFAGGRGNQGRSRLGTAVGGYTLTYGDVQALRRIGSINAAVSIVRNG